jgi:hypothetical protein
MARCCFCRGTAGRSEGGRGQGEGTETATSECRPGRPKGRWLIAVASRQSSTRGCGAWYSSSATPHAFALVEKKRRRSSEKPATRRGAGWTGAPVAGPNGSHPPCCNACASGPTSSGIHIAQEGPSQLPNSLDPYLSGSACFSELPAPAVFEQPGDKQLASVGYGMQSFSV